MLCVEVLQWKPAVFRSLTGLTVEEFWEIYVLYPNMLNT